MEKFYRFELMFDGQPQNVGFLQGLEDAHLPLSQERLCYELFHELPSPMLPPDGMYIFWFTEEGLNEYGSSARIVNRLLKEHAPGWELCGTVMKPNRGILQKAVYTDLWQRVWNLTDLTGDLLLRPFQDLYKLRRQKQYRPEAVA